MKKLHYVLIAMSFTLGFMGTTRGQDLSQSQHIFSESCISAKDVDDTLRSAATDSTAVVLGAGVALSSDSITDALYTASISAREKLVFHFPLGISMLWADYQQNKQEFERLNRFFMSDSMSSVERIVVTGNASLEGSPANNLKLSMSRATETRMVMRWKYSEVINEFNIPIEVHAVYPTDSLEHLRQIICAHPNLPSREKLQYILDAVDKPAEKMERIRRECGNDIYQYIISNFFGELRNASVYILYKGDQGYGFPWNPVPVDDTISLKSTTDSLPYVLPVEPVLTHDTLTTEVSAEPFLQTRRPDPKHAVIALKTNLLFDLATAINAEVEVPLGKRWSIVAGGVFPQWNFSNKYCMTLTEVSLEPRLWLGNRENLRSGKKRNSLTGHFIGVYGNWVDNYDLQWKHAGVMGNGYGMGLTYGYSHRLGRSFNMEYSVGVGALYLETKSYSVSDDYIYKKLSKEHSGWYVLPTRAKISLVWLVGNTRNKTK